MRRIVGGLFEKSSVGDVSLYVSTLTLSEVFYVSSRIYQAANVADPNGEAERFTLWVQSRVNVVDVDAEIALLGAEYKKRPKNSPTRLHRNRYGPKDWW